MGKIEIFNSNKQYIEIDRDISFALAREAGAAALYTPIQPYTPLHSPIPFALAREAGVAASLVVVTT